MRGLQKSKRVSWASDLNLCQVKLFLSDESPSQVGLSGQDHLQAKASWPWNSVGAGSDDNLPPGFEGIQPANLLQNKLSQIPLIQWKCPSRFVLDPNWQVAAGEESKELEVESQREMRVLEAVYPRPSAIPTNPASVMGTDEPYYIDQHTPLIPITPIEDEDMAPDSSSSSITAAANTSLQAPATTEPDVVSAAYSALNAAMSNGSQGSLIDPNLLIKILSNPSIIEKLVSSTQGPSTSGPQISQALSMPTLPPMSVAEPPPPPAPPVHGRTTTHLPFSTAASSSSSSAHYPPPPSRVGPVPVSNLPPPPPPAAEVNSGKKDINYYKSLIQQHGGEKAELMNNNSNTSNNNNGIVKTRGDIKGKIMKPCIYYNSPRGCRHGANCVFQHDSSISSQQQQRASNSNSNGSSNSGLPDAKRMKMDSREISGT